MDPCDCELARLYETFRLPLRRYLARYVREDEADDLLQEVFIKIGRALPGFRGACSVDTWVYRIAKNAAVDRLRGAPPRTVPLAEEPFAELAAPGEELDSRGSEMDTSEPSLDQWLSRKDVNADIARLLASLPDRYRTVLHLSEIDGLTNRQIARALGVNLGTAKARLHRARVYLKSRFAAHCDFYRDERNELACEHKARCPVCTEPDAEAYPLASNLRLQE